MDTLLTEIMMFRELRESIQSEEDAATVIRISRGRGFKSQRHNHRRHEGTQVNATNLAAASCGFMLALPNQYPLKVGRNERFSTVSYRSSGNGAAGHAGARFRTEFSARDPATTCRYPRSCAATRAVR